MGVVFLVVVPSEKFERKLRNGKKEQIETSIVSKSPTNKNLKPLQILQISMRLSLQKTIIFPLSAINSTLHYHRLNRHLPHPHQMSS